MAVEGRGDAQAAEWLRANRDGEGTLAADKRRIAYYAERDWTPLFVGGVLRKAPSLRGDQVRFVVVDDETLGSPDGISQEAGLPLREIHRVEGNGRRLPP